MSGLAAAFRFDGGPAPQPQLAAMIGAAAIRAPDGVTTWVGPGAALARLHRFVLTEQTLDAQPAVERLGPHVAVVDGRLDNRAELASRFRLSPADDDARYVLAAVSALGGSAADALEGDFAFVVWNARTRTGNRGPGRHGDAPVALGMGRSLPAGRQRRRAGPRRADAETGGR